MKTTAAIIIVLLLLLGFNSFYAVGEGQRVLLLQFGKILRTERRPGLHAKVPLLQRALTLDERILSFDSAPQRYATADKQSIKIGYYVKWRIANAADYYRATGGDELQADQRLSPIVIDALRKVVNEHTLDQLVASDQGNAAAGMLPQANAGTQKTLGIAVLDVRITSIELPDDIEAAVYKRMQAERQQQAASIRADGKEQAALIKVETQAQAQMIRVTAKNNAEKLKGEADVQATQIYAQAYAQDSDFFAFYRSLQAYQESFGDGKSTIILKPNSPFMRYFDNPAAASVRH